MKNALIVVVVLLVIGLAWMWYAGKNAPATDTTDTVNAEVSFTQ